MSERRRILILTAGFGEGHNAAARNLMRGIRHRMGEDVDVMVYDIFDRTYLHANDLVRSVYINAINSAPMLWQLFYEFVDDSRLLEQVSWSMRAARNHLGALIWEFRPHAVCTTYPIYNLFIAELTERGLKKNFQQLTVVTDSISINSVWHRFGSDYFLTPNVDTSEVLVRQGVVAEKIAALGFPVPLEFSQERSSPPSLDEGPPRVLYIVNTGKSDAPIIAQDLLRNTDVHLTITAGKDVGLAKTLENMTRPYAERVEILGWIDNMPELLMTHHLVITKAGGATVQEALAAYCPLIVSQVVPGQEEGNWHLIEKNGCGALATYPEAITRTVKDAFAHQASRWKEWKVNIQRISHPHAALDVADFVLQKGTPVIAS